MRAKKGYFASAWGNLALIARMVKIEHAVFALPFAYIGSFWAAGGWPGTRVFMALTAAMVAVRSLAMAVNRAVDLDIDRQNPRTRGRPLVSGEVSLPYVWIFIGICAVVFVLACALLNWTCFILSFPVLLWAGGYSWAKRFTWLSHFWLGSVLALAPLAGWLAYDPVWDPVYLFLFLGVLFWVAGFDILYSVQDREFDQDYGLYSIPVAFGLDRALIISRFCHVNTVIFWGLFGVLAPAGGWYFLAWGIIGLILGLEHRMVRVDDLSRINTAFFTLNGVVAVLLFAGVMADLFF